MLKVFVPNNTDQMFFEFWLSVSSECNGLFHANTMDYLLYFKCDDILLEISNRISSRTYENICELFIEIHGTNIKRKTTYFYWRKDT